MPLRKQRTPTPSDTKPALPVRDHPLPTISNNTPTASSSSLSQSSLDNSRTTSLATSYESAPNLHVNGSPTPTRESMKFFDRRSLPVPPPPPPMTRRYTPPRYSVYRAKPSERSPILLSTIIMSGETLAHLLRWFSWDVFFPLANTCHQYRDSIFDNPWLKDIVFSRYVPGYRYVSLYWDPNYAERQVRSGLMDLHLLVRSFAIPLHLYPSHSLALQSHYQPSEKQHERTARLRDYCLAFSRFVLLLRFRSLLTPFQDSWLELRPSPNQTSPWKAPPNPHRARLKELVFPPPLSIFGEPETIRNNVKTPLGKKASRKGLKLEKERDLPPRPGSQSPFTVSPSPSVSRPQSEVVSSATSAASSRRVKSYVGSKSSKPPPVPLGEPQSMKFYSSNWRRKSRAPNLGFEHELRFGTAATLSEDEYSLHPPNKPWGNGPRTEAGSSAVSFSSTMNSGSGSSNIIPTAPRNKGPHDLASSTIRTRSPVLRVFVPCSSTTPDVLQAIDNEIMMAGLRSYLYVGDVICNLGHVPEESEDESLGEWLVFDGNSIVPLLPSSFRKPQAAELPSPFYYSDILPYDPIVALTLPPYSLTNGTASPPNRKRLPHLTLLLSSSPLHSEVPGAVLRVKKYTWLTSIYVSTSSCLANKIGEGWAGEWVLEAEGTKECKLCLEGALRGEKVGVEDPQLIWEVIRERSGDGKLWLRLLSQPISARVAM